jgi:hypothetical protein
MSLKELYPIPCKARPRWNWFPSTMYGCNSTQLIHVNLWDATVTGE